MLTIRHVESNGRERLFTAVSVERTTDGGFVFGAEEKILSGKIYVMNDAGKTVAVYDFDKQK